MLSHIDFRAIQHAGPYFHLERRLRRIATAAQAAPVPLPIADLPVWPPTPLSRNAPRAGRGGMADGAMTGPSPETGESSDVEESAAEAAILASVARLQASFASVEYAAYLAELRRRRREQVRLVARRGRDSAAAAPVQQPMSITAGSTAGSTAAACSPPAQGVIPCPAYSHPPLPEILPTAYGASPALTRSAEEPSPVTGGSPIGGAPPLRPPSASRSSRPGATLSPLTTASGANTSQSFKGARSSYSTPQYLRPSVEGGRALLASFTAHPASTPTSHRHVIIPTNAADGGSRSTSTPSQSRQLDGGRVHSFQTRGSSESQRVPPVFRLSRARTRILSLLSAVATGGGGSSSGGAGGSSAGGAGGSSAGGAGGSSAGAAGNSPTEDIPLTRSDGGGWGLEQLSPLPPPP